MNDAKTGKELINIKTSPKVKKDARRYEYRGKDLYVSEEGILLDAGTDEEFYNSQAMTAGFMTVCWKNGKENFVETIKRSVTLRNGIRKKNRKKLTIGISY